MFKLLSIIVFVVSNVLCLSLGQIVEDGQCDHNIEIVDNFDVIEFSGSWYEIANYNDGRSNGKCVKTEYTAADGIVTVLNSQVINGTLLMATRTATINGNDHRARLKMTGNVARNNEEDLWILATDYMNYAITYSCENISDNKKLIYSSILSREQYLEPGAQAMVHEALAEVDDLNEKKYLTVDQSADCLYTPETRDNMPVLFRGQCDTNILAVPNFSIQAYVGKWYIIESYPGPYQDGSCTTDTYSLVNNEIEVLHTYIRYQSLMTMTGTANMATTDGSGKFRATLTIAYTTTTITRDFWILGTDYNSYALVYSCVNIDSETMQVNSWKLSRTKQMTMYAQFSIDNIINTTPVLHQNYYRMVDQSDEGCFYYPYTDPSKPVVFPGQCAADIPSMPNLDSTMMQGTWYQIASYPSIIERTGECITHTLYADDNETQLNLESSSVVRQTLNVRNSVVIDANDHLLLIITLDGEQTTTIIPLWVIATDYTSYALTYSCINRDSESRYVMSWQLSRTKSLPGDFGSNMNASIASMDVLHNRYYEITDQSDYACMYYPELSIDEPVIFPGQCDVNIRPIQNFRLLEFLGRWNVIESYYTEYQRGTCGAFEFLPNGTGRSSVAYKEVVEEQLETTTGVAVLATTDGNGLLLVQFPSGAALSEVLILNTDYTTYALVYNCENISPDSKRVRSWKLSRDKSLTHFAVSTINEIINSIDELDNRYFLSVDHSVDGCFYYPTPGVNPPVYFPGQCNTTIPVVQNFNVISFMGTWYNVESYPAPYMIGNCSRTTFTTTIDGSFHIEDTRVSNQRLETFYGSGRVISDDGTARLQATLNVNGMNETIEYVVLDTDFVSYALLYSCENVDPDTRAVYSWKLSRTPSLSATSAIFINQVINFVQVLHQQYYIQNNFNEEACSYYPDEFLVDEVLLPGQCIAHDEVDVIRKFVADRFTGTWYEVSRYPGIQQGACVSTEYISSGWNALTVIHTTVSEAEQRQVITQARVSNDGRGIISAIINGVPFTNLFILATDYFDYALAYSCRNIDSDTKQIYSWKLSRTRSGLSTYANMVIDMVVSHNSELWEGFYMPTRQDDEACYTQPEIEDVPPHVELPGPCPTNIQRVSNFNTRAYLGQWYETARYSTPYQIGQCNRIEYSLSQQLVVIVTEVAEQTLRSQSGSAGISNDGTGLLNIIFNINGETQSALQHILATDYTSYALLYSCIDLDNGNHRVSSWKLSRTPTLSPEGVAAMAPAIANTPDLFEGYYQTTSQTPEDCFYISAINNN